MLASDEAHTKCASGDGEEDLSFLKRSCIVEGARGERGSNVCRNRAWCCENGREEEEQGRYMSEDCAEKEVRLA